MPSSNLNSLRLNFLRDAKFFIKLAEWMARVELSMESTLEHLVGIFGKKESSLIRDILLGGQLD